MRTVLSSGCRRPGGRAKPWWRSFQLIKRALPPVVLTAAAGVTFVLAPVPPASAAPGAQLVALEGATPPAPSAFGAKPQGPAPKSASTSFQVYFQPNNAAQLAALGYRRVHAWQCVVPPLPVGLAVRRSFRPERAGCVGSR